MKHTPELLKLAEEIQIECHNYALKMIDQADTQVIYNDCVLTYIFLKLAELQILHTEKKE